MNFTFWLNIFRCPVSAPLNCITSQVLKILSLQKCNCANLFCSVPYDQMYRLKNALTSFISFMDDIFWIILYNTKKHLLCKVISSLRPDTQESELVNVLTKVSQLTIGEQKLIFLKLSEILKDHCALKTKSKPENYFLRSSGLIFIFFLSYEFYLQCCHQRKWKKWCFYCWKNIISFSFVEFIRFHVGKCRINLKENV